MSVPSEAIVAMEDASILDEGQSLRRCVRELAALSTLSAAWDQSDPHEIADGLGLVLSRSMDISFIYVRIVADANTDFIQVVRNKDGPSPPDESEAVVRALEPYLMPGPRQGITIDDPCGKGPLQLALVPIGVGSDCGILVAGSTLPGFPAQTDRLILGVAANQAAAVLQRRRADEQLRRSERKLADFFENAAVGLHWVGPDGIILRANRAELELLGYAPEEYIGHHIAEFHADPIVIDDILRRLRAGETLHGYEARLRCKDGSIKHVMISSNVLWEDGNFLHTRCFTRDITERKLAELALHQSTAQFETLLNEAPLGVYLVDSDFRIRQVNPTARAVFGNIPDLIGRDFEEVIHTLWSKEYAAEVVQRFRRTLETGEAYRTPERSEMRKDRGVTECYEWQINRIPLPDGSLGVVCYFQDISSHVLARQALHEREEALRAADRRKDEFLAILAHELRNPLAPVRNAAHFLRLKEVSDPDLKRPIEMIDRQVTQMARLIDDLLDVSRISRGKLELRRERLQFSEVVQAAVDACRDDILSAGHELHVELPPTPVELHADRTRLVQVLCNVIGNATKYTPPRGRIDLRASVSDALLEVHVRDNGIGIPPDRLGEIFELFAQVDRSLERQGGLGIGLTLVRELVELHGGTVEARSAGVGLGSELVVRLPIATPEPAAEVNVVAIPGIEPRRILVADDNHDAAESLALLLAHFGHEVRVAFDGEAALAEAKEFMPHVALLDIGMPKANGYDVARRIREAAWGGRMGLVALTGWGQEGDRRRAQDAGFNAHLVKPVAPDALNALLATLQGRSAASSERGS